jgi:hypothetical protein
MFKNMLENNDDLRIVPLEEDEEDGVFLPYDDPDMDDNLPEIDW